MIRTWLYRYSSGHDFLTQTKADNARIYQCTLNLHLRTPSSESLELHWKTNIKFGGWLVQSRWVFPGFTSTTAPCVSTTKRLVRYKSHIDWMPFIRTGPSTHKTNMGLLGKILCLVACAIGIVCTLAPIIQDRDRVRSESVYKVHLFLPQKTCTVNWLVRYNWDISPKLCIVCFKCFVLRVSF